MNFNFLVAFVLVFAKEIVCTVDNLETMKNHKKEQ